MKGMFQLENENWNIVEDLLYEKSQSLFMKGMFQLETSNYHIEEIYGNCRNPFL
mgnify:CR=1 FL=1